jgi:hypothetical protein
MNHDQPDPAQPRPKPLGRLVLELPDGRREILATLQSGKPLNEQGIMEALTQAVGGALDPRPSVTDNRSHDPGNPAPLPVKAQAQEQPAHRDVKPGNDRPSSSLFPPVKRQG